MSTRVGPRWGLINMNIRRNAGLSASFIVVSSPSGTTVWQPVGGATKMDQSI